MAKKGIHPTTRKVKVVDIHGYEFVVTSTVQDDVIKAESTYLSHPAYNPDKVQKKVVVGRLQSMNAKLEKMEQMRKSA